MCQDLLIWIPAEQFQIQCDEFQGKWKLSGSLTAPSPTGNVVISDALLLIGYQWHSPVFQCPGLHFKSYFTEVVLLIIKCSNRENVDCGKERRFPLQPSHLPCCSNAFEVSSAATQDALFLEQQPLSSTSFILLLVKSRITGWSAVHRLISTCHAQYLNSRDGKMPVAVSTMDRE